MDDQNWPQQDNQRKNGNGKPMCQRHPDHEAVARCVDCGRSFCAGCVFDWEGDHICRSCIRVYRASNFLQPDEEPARDEEWSPRQLFTFQLFRTILLSPGRFFERMPRDRGIAEPVFFAFSWGLLILVLSAPSKYLTLLLIASQASSLSGMAPRVVEIAEKTIDEGFLAFVLSAPAYTIILLTLLFALASIQHILLYVMGRKPRFELTMRVSFFSVVAQSLAILPVPGLSVLAALAYTVAVQTVGFKKVYHLGTGAALFVSALPILVVESLPAGVGGL